MLDRALKLMCFGFQAEVEVEGMQANLLSQESLHEGHPRAEEKRGMRSIANEKFALL
jgi:hypothetical protein